MKVILNNNSNISLVCNKFYLEPDPENKYFFNYVSENVILTYPKERGDISQFWNFKIPELRGEYGIKEDTLYYKVSLCGIDKLYRNYTNCNISNVTKVDTLPYNKNFGTVNNLFNELYFSIDNEEEYLYYLLQGNEPLFDIKE